LNNSIQTAIGRRGLGYPAVTAPQSNSHRNTHRNQGLGIEEQFNANIPYEVQQAARWADDPGG
jgi:hypothetical protein